MTITVDSHQHFWSLARGDYGWLTPEMTELYKDFNPDHLSSLLSRTGVEYTVLVQAAPTIEETRYLLTIAEKSDFVAGVVGWVDFDDPSKAVTDLTEFTRQSKFVGVRPMIHDIDDPCWMLRASHQPVFKKLIDLDFCFDALVRPQHLPNLQELINEYPALRIVIDHGAKPTIKDRDWQPWASDIQTLAANTNAYCKLSGLFTEALDGAGYEDVAPYLDHLLKCFGAERLMWGSDWPVLNLNGDYIHWHATIMKWLESLGEPVRAAILGKNANRFYRLGL